MNVNKYLFERFPLLEVLPVLVTLSGSLAVITVVSAIASNTFMLLVMGGILPGIFATMLLTIIIEVTKKKQELAILRVLGVKKRHILGTILLRCTILGGLGVGLGIGTGILLNPTLQSSTEPWMATLVMLSALAASLSGGVVAARTFWKLNLSEVIRD